MCHSMSANLQGVLTPDSIVNALSLLSYIAFRHLGFSRFACLRASIVIYPLMAIMRLPQLRSSAAQDRFRLAHSFAIMIAVPYTRSCYLHRAIEASRSPRELLFCSEDSFLCRLRRFLRALRCLLRLRNLCCALGLLIFPPTT